MAARVKLSARHRRWSPLGSYRWKPNRSAAIVVFPHPGEATTSSRDSGLQAAVSCSVVRDERGGIFLRLRSVAKEEVEEASDRRGDGDVMTGGTGRVEAGLKLLQAGAAPRLFISGVNKDVKVHELIRGQEANAAITLGYEAEDTKGNADETHVISDIKLQNRATRGKSIMTLYLGDTINKVDLN